MNKIKAFIAAFTLSMSVLPSFAATHEGNFAVYGWGARDCKTIIAVLQGDAAAQARGQLAEWISGYITAQNRIADSVYDIVPVKSHYALVSLTQSICANNLDQSLEGVISAIVQNFATLKLSTESSIVTLTYNDQSVDLNEATLRIVQDFLVANDHLDAAAADGKFGPQTAMALERWQEASGLSPNGLPDIVTLFFLAQKLR